MDRLQVRDDCYEAGLYAVAPQLEVYEIRHMVSEESSSDSSTPILKSKKSKYATRIKGLDE